MHFSVWESLTQNTAVLCGLPGWETLHVQRGLLPPAACHHLHCNSALFLSMKLEPANWLRKVFSYETHSGEVSETSSQCSKLNPVPLGKSAKTILSHRNYVQGPKCARGGRTTCQTMSQTDSAGHVKTQRRQKGFPFFLFNFLRILLYFTWLITSFEKTLHGQYHPFTV